MFSESAIRASSLTLATGLDPHSRQHFKKIIHYAIGVTVKARCEASPEPPTDAFEHSLPAHILSPLLGTVVSIAVAFHRKPPSVGTLHDNINPVSNGAYLSLHPISAFQQSLHQIA